MGEHEESRTLVKSPPELWGECSNAASLARHLGQFGEIRITRLEPETAVAWEGEFTRGTVRLEPSGWGTRVVLTARALEALGDEPAARTVDGEPTLPTGEQEPAGNHPTPPAPEPEPPTPEPEPPAPEPERPPQQGLAPVPELALLPMPAGRRHTLSRRSSSRGVVARFRDLFGPRAARVPEAAAPIAVDPTPAESPPPAESPTPAESPKAAESPKPAAPLEPAQPPEPATSPDISELPEDAGASAALIAALDSLGQAHHRPFSRG